VGWLESRERKDWPTFLRGDIAHGNEKMMQGAEQRGVPYLFTEVRNNTVTI